MATPHVRDACASSWEANPALTPDQIKAPIVAEHVGDPPAGCGYAASPGRCRAI